MEPRHRNEYGSSYGRSAIAVALLLGSAWSTPLLAAANAALDCDKLARGLRNLDTPVEVLAVTNVDHGTVDQTASKSAPAESAASELQVNTDDAATPFLYLSPRVASLSRNVFEAGRYSLAPNQTQSSLPSSPVADSESAPAGAEELDDASPLATEEKFSLPLFQREMYRTDI